MIKITDQHQKIFSINKRVRFHFNPKRLESYQSLTKKRGLSEHFANQLRLVYDAAEEIYPDKVDLEIVYKVETEVHVNTYGYNAEKAFEVFKGYKVDYANLYILFPEFTIDNGREQGKHIIRDMMIMIRIYFNGDSKRLLFEQIDGTRLTITVREGNMGYLHSHMNSGYGNFSIASNRASFNNFCTGDGEINMTLGMINGGLTENNIRLHLLQIATYLEWESLDGGPYIKYKDLATKDIRVHNCPLNWSTVINQIKRSRVVPKLNWSMLEDELTLIDDDNLEEYLREVFNNPDYITSREMFYFKAPDGNLYNIQGRDYLAKVHTFLEHVIFKKNKIFIKIIEDRQEEEIESHPERIKENLFINPNLKQYVITKFNQHAKKAIFRNSIIEQCKNKSKRLRSCTESN